MNGWRTDLEEPTTLTRGQEDGEGVQAVGFFKKNLLKKSNVISDDRGH